MAEGHTVFRLKYSQNYVSLLLMLKKQACLAINMITLLSVRDLLIRALATVGIIALVDEATGYQDTRLKAALAKILEKYIVEEYRPWTMTFPHEFYKEIFRLKGWKRYDPNRLKRPSVIGHYTK